MNKKTHPALLLYLLFSCIPGEDGIASQHGMLQVPVSTLDLKQRADIHDTSDST